MRRPLQRSEERVIPHPHFRFVKQLASQAVAEAWKNVSRECRLVIRVGFGNATVKERAWYYSQSETSRTAWLTQGLLELRALSANYWVMTLSEAGFDEVVAEILKDFVWNRGADHE